MEIFTISSTNWNIFVKIWKKYIRISSVSNNNNNNDNNTKNILEKYLTVGIFIIISNDKNKNEVKDIYYHY